MKPGFFSLLLFTFTENSWIRNRNSSNFIKQRAPKSNVSTSIEYNYGKKYNVPCLKLKKSVTLSSVTEKKIDFLDLTGHIKKECSFCCQ